MKFNFLSIGTLPTPYISKVTLKAILRVCSFSLLLSALLILQRREANAQQVCSSCNFPSSLARLCQVFGVVPPTLSYNFPLSSSSLGTNNWTNQTIVIDNVFTVNSNFSIQQCTLIFTGKGRIEVKNMNFPNSFICSNSKLFSCDANGWSGITVGANGFMNFSNNHIEDAINAVEITSPTAIVILNGNNFNRNINAVNVSGVVANAIVLSNTFQCTSNTFAGTRSETGVLVQNAGSIGIGLTGQATGANENIFNNLQSGIKALSGSNIRVYNCRFQCSALEAISLSNSTAQIGRSLSDIISTTSNYFCKNFYDIRGTASNVTIHRNEFRECFIDNITLKDNHLAEKILIKDNDIIISGEASQTTIKMGIILDRSSGSTSANYTNQILDNHFTVEDYGAPRSRRSISVVGYPGTNDLMKIDNNVFDFGSGGNPPPPPGQPVSPTIRSSMIDIEINEASKYIISNNVIESTNSVNSNGFRWGVYLYNWKNPSRNNFLIDNQVYTHSNIMDFGCCAFHFETSGPWNICRNRTNFTLRGFHIDGNCMPSRFIDNEIGNHKSLTSDVNRTAGLLLEEYALVGPQSCRFNVWNLANYTPDFGAWYKGNNYEDNRFIISSANNSLPNPRRIGDPPLNDNNQWIRILPEVCQDTATCNPLTLLNEEGLDTLESGSYKTIQSNLYYSNPINAVQWEQRKNAFLELLYKPHLLETDNKILLFFNNFINESEGKFADFEFNLFQAHVLDSIYLAEKSTRFSDIVQYFHQMDSLGNSIGLESFGIDSTKWKLRAENGLNIYASIAQNTIQDSIVEVLLQERIEQLSLDLLELPANSTIEKNWKFLYRIQLQKTKGIPVSALQEDTCRAMAMQCYEDGAYSSYYAMPYLENGSPYFRLLEEPMGERCGDRYEVTGQHYSTLNNVSLFPNPSNGEILNLAFDSDLSGTVEIFNSTGGLNSSFSFENSKVNEPISLRLNLLPGLYVVRVQNSTGITFARRLIVLR